jgi:serine/threonine protein kinase
MNEESLFAAALEKQDVAERQAFLEEACGQDIGMRQRLEQLLAAHEHARGILERGPGDAALKSDAHEPAIAADRVFAGRFKLREKLGEGGMGEVWVADQTKPVQRRVALKVIRPGFDSVRMLARFDQERQALAVMDHPNIAKVLDAGIDETERPYFAMELIKGVPITKYCDEAKLSPQQRLALFIPVCHAVQHAHQKGIIHRDLKPSNILIGLYDGKPVPKVIDFGVAKSIGPRLTEQSIYTEVGALIGTLEYMSPEQAELNNLDIDTRCDIYSLGAVLYELLTGSVPFSRQDFQAAALTEMLRIIKEMDPPKPSTKLSGSGTLPNVAVARQTEPKKLIALLRGELDWIVIKCLEKNRGRRYETANGLAIDLQRYLANEPVVAGPPSASYRLRKFFRRNRALVSALTTIAAALLLGTTVAVWQAVVATRARNDTLNALSAETEAKRQADAKEAETRAVLDFVERNVFAAARPQGEAGGLGESITVRQALEAALPFVATRFKEQPLTEARLRMTMGKSFQYLGEFKIAAEQFQIARTLYSDHRGLDDRDTLDSMDWLAESYRYMSRNAEALELQLETLAGRKIHLGPNDPDTLRSMNNLAICYYALGRTAEALQLHQETLERRQLHLGLDHPETLQSMNNLAECYGALGRHSDALLFHQKTLALMKTQLVPDHPDTLVSMSNVASTLLALGRYGEAVGLLEDTLRRRKARLSPTHPETLESMSSLAVCYRCLGRHAEALQLIQEALAVQKAKLGPDHPDTLESMHDLACIRFAMGQHPDGLKLYEEALAVRKAKLGADHQDVLKSIREMAGLRLHDYAKTGDVAGCRAMVEMCEKLKPTDPASCYDAACFRAVTAAVIRAGGKPSAATQADAEADRALAWLKQAVASGYKEAAHMKEDKDLDALRDRADFRKLLSDLESAADKQKND